MAGARLGPGPREIEIMIGRSGEFLGENRGLWRGHIFAFCCKTNHQEQGFSIPVSPINALRDEILI